MGIKVGCFIPIFFMETGFDESVFFKSKTSRIK